MFERFTGAARDVVVAAQAESRALGHDYIGTEHLLVAVAAAPAGPGREAIYATGVTVDALRAAVAELVGEGPGAGPDAAALASIGIDLDEVRRRVEDTFGPGALERRRSGSPGRAPFTKRAKKALELALRYAVARGDRHIGPEHILLGILKDGGLATEALAHLGVPAERVRERLAVPSA
jgi:ATP-dependent Clp protease ATP-binding subunit ClpA